ncbi:MAG: hypothetical protein JSS81_03690 [Acidobacteria bacterium]|nr:hypothetical protein [Acidobacteriota bacterium]
MIKMRSIIVRAAFSGALIAVFGGLFAAAGQTDRRIEEIRRISREVSAQIAECETAGATSTTFLTELVVNRNGGPYPAVGIYRAVVKFFYTFGDREKNPYPDRLLKIVVSVDRAAAGERSEYLLNERGELIFYYEKKEETETRLYFASEKPIRTAVGEKTVEPRAKAGAAGRALAEKRRLIELFRNSLNF